MPVEPLFDLSAVDLTRDVVPLDEIRACVPHRFEFALLDGIVHFDPVTLNAVALTGWAKTIAWTCGCFR